MCDIKRILQIIPANGWKACHKDNNEIIKLNLVSWALVEYDDGATGIVGYDTDDNGVIECSENSINFKGYEFK